MHHHYVTNYGKKTRHASSSSCQTSVLPFLLSSFRPYVPQRMKELLLRVKPPNNCRRKFFCRTIISKLKRIIIPSVNTQSRHEARESRFGQRWSNKSSSSKRQHWTVSGSIESQYSSLFEGKHLYCFLRGPPPNIRWWLKLSLYVWCNESHFLLKIYKS